jgi:DNA-directed RNA polymerase specialized sigma24 family protein
MMTKPETLAQARRADLKAARLRDLETSAAAAAELAASSAALDLHLSGLVLLLHDRHGVPFAQLAALLGVSRQAVHRRYRLTAGSRPSFSGKRLP